MSAARPGASTPTSRPCTRAVLPVAIATATSGATPPSDARWAITRRIPSGTTPVPDGASLPMITRRSPSSASPSLPQPAAIRTASIAARPLPQWTISIAMSVPTTRSMSSSDIGVVPPLTWPTMCGFASRTASAAIGFEPAIDGPPVWNVTVMPCCFAQATIGAACAPVLTLPSPISPTSVTPPAAISAKSCSSSPSSRIGAPALTFTPAGRRFAYAFAATIASAFSPMTSFGRPGRWTSPAEMTEVTPPCRPDSMKFEHLLAGREVAEDRVGVRVDQPGHRRRALGVDRLVDPTARARVAVQPAPDGRDPAVLDQDRVGVGERRRRCRR